MKVYEDSLVHKVAPPRRMFKTPKGKIGWTDAESDMPSGIPESVEYVQKSDDSRNSAIRIAYRNSLRPSS